VRLEPNAIDSAILGRAVFEVRDLEPGDDLAALAPAGPALAIAKVAAGDIAGIRALEDAGFRFAEFQLELIHRLKARPEVGNWPYRWAPALDGDLEEVLALAASIFTHDRYSTDPELGPALSGSRYQAYVHRSFATEGEHVYAMRSADGGAILSFATFRWDGGREARLLVGGVAEAMKGTGLGVIHDQLGLATYWDLGIRTLHTAVSGHNTPILNLEVAYLGFKAVRSWLVLHRHFGQDGP